MSQITYANKEAIIENADIPVTGKVTDDDMNEIKQVVNENETKILLAVDSVAPEECSTGDMYYNTTDNLIYTATATDTWSSTGTTPTLNTIYVDFSTQSTYVYNGTTLISVGGGAGGGDSTPIGTIQEYAGSTAPDGYLMCDGSAISRTTYKDLFQVIGTTYGSGDGSTTFNLPDIKGRVVVMLDSNDTDFDTLGETGGEKTHTLINSELPTDTLIFNSNSTGNFFAEYRGSDNGNFDSQKQVTQAQNNLQPYIVLNKIIKATKTTPTQAQVVNTYSDSTTDAYSCDYINNSDSYSTSEIKTNKTWIDGKPIYRKVIRITLTATQQSTSINVNNVSKIISFDGVTNTGLPINFYFQPANTFISTFVDTNNIYNICSSGYSGNTADVILEYTKTTD